MITASTITRRLPSLGMSTSPQARRSASKSGTRVVGCAVFLPIVHSPEDTLVLIATIFFARGLYERRSEHPAQFFYKLLDRLGRFDSPAPNQPGSMPAGGAQVS
jgi:hypothetical protein